MKLPGWEEYFIGYVFFAVTVCVLSVVALLDYKVCELRSRQMGFPWNWNPISGCMIEPSPGIWIPLDNYIIVLKPLV